MFDEVITKNGKVYYVIHRAWSTTRNGHRIYPKNGSKSIRLEIPAEKFKSA